MSSPRASSRSRPPCTPACRCSRSCRGCWCSARTASTAGTCTRSGPAPRTQCRPTRRRSDTADIFMVPSNIFQQFTASNKSHMSLVAGDGVNYLSRRSIYWPSKAQSCAKDGRLYLSIMTAAAAAVQRRSLCGL